MNRLGEALRFIPAKDLIGGAAAMLVTTGTVLGVSQSKGENPVVPFSATSNCGFEDNENKLPYKPYRHTDVTLSLPGLDTSKYATKTIIADPSTGKIAEAGKTSLGQPYPNITLHEYVAGPRTGGDVTSDIDFQPGKRYEASLTLTDPDGKEVRVVTVFEAASCKS